MRMEKEKEMELEELEALIAQKLAENAALELQMASIDFDSENEKDHSPEQSQKDQEDPVPQHHSMPTGPQAEHRDELYDPFLMDNEYKQQLQGDAEVVQIDDLRSHDPPLTDRSVMLCGEEMDPVLCIEVQVHRQTDVDDEESDVYGERVGLADGCECPLGQEKSLVPHDREKENKTPSQHEQHLHLCQSGEDGSLDTF